MLCKGLAYLYAYPQRKWGSGGGVSTICAIVLGVDDRVCRWACLDDGVTLML